MDQLQDWYEALRESWGAQIGATVVVVVIALILRWIIKRAVERWIGRIERRYAESDHQTDREQAQRLVTISTVVRLVLSITLWVIVVLTVMAIWGIPMAPLLAVGATVGIAVGFGAQDFVKDVIGGFMILVEDQYAIGDVVTIAGVSGSVEAITLRTTVLRDLEGIQHHVPNGDVRVSSNLTAAFSRVVVDVPVSYDTDLDRAIEVLGDEAHEFAYSEEWRNRFLEEPVMLGVNKLGDSGIDIRVLLTTTTEERWAVKRGFLKAAKERLDAEGIEIPYQYINVVMQGDDDGQSSEGLNT